MKQMQTLSVLFSALVITVALANAEGLRTWTGSSGKTVEAEFVSLDGTRVALKGPNGKQMVTSLDALSQQDQEYVRRITCIVREIRTVDGVAYDFTPVARALREANRVSQKVGDLMERVRAGEDIPDAVLVAKQVEIECRKIMAPVSIYRILGTVTQVLPDGILVQSPKENMDGYEGLVFVKGYHAQKTVVDGDDVNAHGMPRGRYQYVSTIGSTKTIPSFVCGKRVNADEWKGEILPLP